MTAADLHLWLVILDAAVNESNGLVTLSQDQIARGMGRVIRDRLQLSFDRMVRYDVWLGNSIGPMIKGAQWDRAKGGGIEWTISLDYRVVRAVRESKQAGRGVAVPCDVMRKLTSRTATIVWLRMLGWKAGEYPATNIPFAKHHTGTGYRVVVNTNNLGWFYGFDEVLYDSEIKARFHSKAPTCAIAKDLLNIDIDYETSWRSDQMEGGFKALEVQLAELEVHDPIVIPEGKGKFDKLKQRGSARY